MDEVNIPWEPFIETRGRQMMNDVFGCLPPVPGESFRDIRRIFPVKDWERFRQFA
jgi:hypothetical protein